MTEDQIEAPAQDSRHDQVLQALQFNNSLAHYVSIHHSDLSGLQHAEVIHIAERYQIKKIVLLDIDPLSPLNNEFDQTCVGSWYEFQQQSELIHEPFLVLTSQAGLVELHEHLGVYLETLDAAYVLPSKLDAETLSEIGFSALPAGELVTSVSLLCPTDLLGRNTHQDSSPL